ncbi:molybdate-transporting ATPase [Geotalea uraniireducens]|uniref:Molybdate-transporting ATPase n=1 Tax=Geotalea uraniireducens TaxID=351604 RepID=A0ABN6VVJ9_9BACT|nr:molybdenum ABC transporter ATP-binding protein [Geotalea uraniireducens]BDV44364.1 molybdate-transporting ATPase [Geotalea uraniireducens]
MELQVQVSKRYDDFSLEADFAVAGERFGIFGDSGSGKSTLVGMLTGLVTPDRGEIVFNGEPLFSSRQRLNIPPERRRIGMVFQHPHLFPHLSVRSNLLYGFKRCAPEYRRVDFAALVEVLKIGHLLDRGVTNLSGGEKQRVAIGRAVLSNPRLLLMDEPLSALDDSLRFQIIPYLKNVCENFGIPYLFISHSLVEMRLMAERVIVFERGRQVEETEAEELARGRIGTSPVGYINLLRLREPVPQNSLYAYRWGDLRLLLTAPGGAGESMFELSSKDLILFKKHPEAISARNLLECTVSSLFTSGNKVGLELTSAGGVLVAEIAGDTAREMEIAIGSKVFAAIKASAFRPLG